MRRPRAVAAGLLALALCTAAAAPQAEPAVEPAPARVLQAAPLVVAVREVPPFAMRDAAGNWEGLSVDLWQDAADKLDWEFSWRELDLAATLSALEAGEVDAAVAALTITAEREQRLDFSHPYYISGLALAHRAGGRSGAWLSTLKGFFTREFLVAVGSLAVVLLIAGFAIYLFERRANAEQFGDGKTLRGIGDGFWWSAVTMTTVGYGDKAPRTVGGRIVALIWMFASLIIIAGFTASIAASLTTNRLQPDLLLQQGLGKLTVGVVEASSADEFATARAGRVRRFPSLDAALAALQDEQVQVVLHDAPILKHLARERHDWLQVADSVLVRDDYGYGLPANSNLREPLNAALLSILNEPIWQDIRGRYLGDSEDQS